MAESQETTNTDENTDGANPGLDAFLSKVGDVMDARMDAWAEKHLTKAPGSRTDGRKGIPQYLADLVFGADKK